MSVPFRQYMDVLSKSPAPAHGLAAHGWAASAKRGGLSLWLSFSLATQRESNSAAEGRRKLLPSNAVAPSKSIARERAPTRHASFCAADEVRFLPLQE
jgi:hypothetical protein